MFTKAGVCLSFNMFTLNIVWYFCDFSFKASAIFIFSVGYSVITMILVLNIIIVTTVIIIIIIITVITQYTKSHHPHLPLSILEPVLLWCRDHRSQVQTVYTVLDQWETWRMRATVSATLECHNDESACKYSQNPLCYQNL